MRAMVSPALPALTVLTARIERLGQSCASAAGANVMKAAHAMAPHDMRNDIATSLVCRRSSDRLRWSRFSSVTWGRWAAPPDLGPALHRDGPMMLPIGAHGQPAACALRSCVAWAPRCLFLSRPSLAKIADLERPRRPSQGIRHFNPTHSPGPLRASRVLAPTHVGRKECLQCVTTV